MKGYLYTDGGRRFSLFSLADEREKDAVLEARFPFWETDSDAVIFLYPTLCEGFGIEAYERGGAPLCSHEIFRVGASFLLYERGLPLDEIVFQNFGKSVLCVREASGKIVTNVGFCKYLFSNITVSYQNCGFYVDGVFCNSDFYIYRCDDLCAADMQGIFRAVMRTVPTQGGTLVAVCVSEGIPRIRAWGASGDVPISRTAFSAALFSLLRRGVLPPERFYPFSGRDEIAVGCDGKIFARGIAKQTLKFEISSG